MLNIPHRTTDANMEPYILNLAPDSSMFTGSVCVYLAWGWHPVGGVPNVGRGRSARHCMWSEGWVGERHGTAGPPAPYSTAKHREGRKKLIKREARHSEQSNKPSKWAFTAHQRWCVDCLLRYFGAEMDECRRGRGGGGGVGRAGVWVRGGENEKQGGREGTPQGRGRPEVSGLEIKGNH